MATEDATEAGEEGREEANGPEDTGVGTVSRELAAAVGPEDAGEGRSWRELAASADPEDAGVSRPGEDRVVATEPEEAGRPYSAAGEETRRRSGGGAEPSEEEAAAERGSVQSLALWPKNLQRTQRMPFRHSERGWPEPRHRGQSPSRSQDGRGRGLIPGPRCWRRGSRGRGRLRPCATCQPSRVSAVSSSTRQISERTEGRAAGSEGSGAGLGTPADGAGELQRAWR